MKEEKKEEIITNKDNKKEKKEQKNKVKEESIKITKEEIEAMNKKITEAEEKVLRTKADLINYRKRKDEEVQRILKYSNEDLVLELLPILDNFERALSINEESKLAEGMKMVYTQLISVLNKFEVKEIESLNKKFNPTYHQAVITGHDDKFEEDIVLEVMQKGYLLKDKVIRPAMVKVNK